MRSWMFKFIGRLIAAHPWLVCLSWLVGGALLTCVSPNWDKQTQDDDVRFLPARCPSVRGYHLLEKSFPQDVFACKAIFTVERKDAPLTDLDFALVDRYVQEVNQLKKDDPNLQIGAIRSHRDPLIGERLTSADKRCTLIQVALA